MWEKLEPCISYNQTTQLAYKTKWNVHYLKTSWYSLNISDYYFCECLQKILTLPSADYKVMNFLIL